MDEVATLQMVEHVITGVEREQRKSLPQSYDDLTVKRALHDFLMIAENVDSPEHAQTEFQLMQETENWFSALAQRDRKISVAHLRRYCDTTKPSLSSQALIALARFYRNSPYSEAVRGKFDLVFTKLFSKDTENEKRAAVFESEDLVSHIQELYAEWSSIPLYSTDEDDSELLVTAMKFQDFITEVQTADSFDELVRKEFFKRLKKVKEEASENFFAPVVVASAIESNIVVGNCYVDLIELERSEPDAITLAEKYGLSHDDAVSEAASKTLELLELLEEKDEPAPKPQVEVSKERAEKEKKKPKPKETGFSPFIAENPRKLNVWLVAATVVVAIVCALFFVMGPSSSGEELVKGDHSAKELNLAGTSIENHVSSARLSKSTMYGVVRSSWGRLEKHEQEALLRNAIVFGREKGFNKVTLINSKGESVGFGSPKRVKVY